MIFDNFKKLLLEQYKNSENIIKILEIVFDQCEFLENVFDDLKNILDIENQSGSVLDLIGDIISEKRNGLNDYDYKKQIKFAIFKNTSRGFVVDIIKIIKFLTNANLVVYSDNPPASYTIYTDGSEIPNNLSILMDKLSPAGVSLIVYCSAGEKPFIAKNISTNSGFLIDDDQNQIVDDALNPLSIDYSVVNDNLQEIFNGGNFGYIQNFLLTSNENEVIITDTGAEIAVYDENQNIIDSAKANFLM